MQSLLVRILSKEYAITVVSNRRALLNAIQNGPVDLALLDLMLPNDDGLDVLRTLRSASKVPIIIISGIGNPETIESGLNLGADDYVTKPFHAPILQARIRSVLRRYAPVTPPLQLPPTAQPSSMIVAQIHDPLRRTLTTTSGETLVLTERESHILSILIEKEPRNATRDEIMRRVTGAEWDPMDRSLDVHISRLRQKVLTATGGDFSIDAVRGAGYRLRPTNARVISVLE